MVWFKREKEGITTSTKEKKETPEGFWYQCPKCKTVVTADDHAASSYVCSSCTFHSRVGSKEYFEVLFDEGKFTEFAENLTSADPLEFTDTKNYKDRVKATMSSSGLKDAIRTAHGKIHGQQVVIACMDFGFIGGSMGSVMGEKIARAADKAMELNCGLIIISKSGGARMMEAGLSLMQMAKTSAKLTQLSEKKLPYISYLTDPTTGGVTASFAMLGDLNVAEPEALIGFAGPRVVKETIGRDLPDGFQTSEFVLEHGFLDYISDRREMKDKIGQSLKFFYK
jgi:acetyl-CoA carboxylase carboxyl transferase subunit beta